MEPEALDPWSKAARAPELTEREKEVRSHFVNEYLVDFNGYAAALRMGYHEAFAREYSARFLSEPFVQQQIRIRELEVIDVDNEELTKKRVIAMLMKEANSYNDGSSQSARVAALGKLATIFGMDKEAKKQTTDGPIPQLIIGGQTEEEYEAEMEELRANVVPIGVSNVAT